MSAIRRIGICLTVCTALGGCGTFVPNIVEFTSDKITEQQLVQAVVQAVTCELRDAVNGFYEKQHRKHLFIDSWGAQLTLTLTVEESTTINPTAMWMPNVMFSLFGGINASSDATRTDIINSYHTIQELLALKSCTQEERPVGPFLLESDLKLENLLFDSQISSDTGQVNFNEQTPGSTNVISHEVKFIVISSGNITPAWKVSRIFTVNQNSTFLAALRNRTQDLLITLGTTTQNGTALSQPAASIALSSQIGIAVSTATRTAIQP